MNEDKAKKVRNDLRHGLDVMMISTDSDELIDSCIQYVNSVMIKKHIFTGHVNFLILLTLYNHLISERIYVDWNIIENIFNVSSKHILNVAARYKIHIATLDEDRAYISIIERARLALDVKFKDVRRVREIILCDLLPSSVTIYRRAAATLLYYCIVEKGGQIKTISNILSKVYNVSVSSLLKHYYTIKMRINKGEK